MGNREMVLLVAAVAGVGAMLIFMLVRLAIARVGARLHRRLNNIDAGSSDVLVKAAGRKGADSWAARLDRAFEAMVQRSGTDLSASEAMALMLLIGLVLAIAFFLVREELWIAMLGLVAGVGGGMAVFIYLESRFRRQLQEQLPDAFYLLARSLRAGLSLDQAIELVGQHGTKPLSAEFQRCSGQIKLGLPVRLALEQAAERVRLLDFNAFVSTVALYQTTGGNLAQQLDRLAAGMRDRNQFRGYFRSATALGRITAIALGLVVPVLLLGYALFQPEHVQAFFSSTTGWIALGVALFLEVAGALWLYYILRMEY